MNDTNAVSLDNSLSRFSLNKHHDIIMSHHTRHDTAMSPSTNDRYMPIIDRYEDA